MAPVVSVYPASEEFTEHERLMRFQSRLPGRGCAYYKKKRRKRWDTTAALERRSRSQRRVARTGCAYYIKRKSTERVW